MPKGEGERRSRSTFEKFLYRSVYLLINFFITVGEITEFLLFLPIKFFFTIQQTIQESFIFIGKIMIRSFIFLRKKTARAVTKIQALPEDRSRALTLLKKTIAKATVVTQKIISRKKSKSEPERQEVSQPLLLKLRYFVLGFSLALFIVFLYQTYLFAESLPSPKNIGKVNYPLSTHIYDRNGRLLYEIYREQNRTPIKLVDLPPFIWQTTIAVEDKDFFKHSGVSPIGGIFRALKEDVLTGQLQGGSTITQQLVKAALLTPEKTLQRKFKEIILALWAERVYNKEQILEMYLNQVPYGGSSYGIEEAASTYFGKHAQELNLAEAAFLAGLPQAPTLYSPYTNPQAALKRRNGVLKGMLEQKYISQSQYNKANAEPLKVNSPRTQIKAPHFVFYVKDDLVKKFGIRTVEEGGLRVTTTLDLTLQERVEEFLREEMDNLSGLNVTNGAILVTRPKTGEVLAMVGSADYFASPSGAFNVTTALRQPGSSIKPLMYSLALEKGYTGATVLDDSPVTFTNPWGESYKPVNYDGRFHGRLPLRFALANSYNVPAVKVLNSIGVDSFVTHARQLGISTWDDPSRFGLSLTLGGGEVTMIDMAKSFGVFANLGERKDISAMMKVADVGGDTIYEDHQPAIRVLDPAVGYIISDILSDNQARTMAFGTRSALEIPNYRVAVKTGTTDNKKDNWTIGYTPEFMVVVWVGNNDNTPMNPQLTSGITGAAPIWNRVMTYLLTNYSTQNSWFSLPENIAEKSCYGAKREVFIKGTEGRTNCVDYRIGPSPTPINQVILPN